MATRPARRAVWALAVLVLAACGGSGEERSLPTSTAAPPATSTGPEPTTTAAPNAPAPSTPVTATESAPVAEGSESGFAAEITPVTAADLGASWREDCPVGPESLRMVRLTHWGFDDRPHDGALVVDAEVADDVVGIFRELYDRRFPIRRMEPVDAFGGDDDASMAADNTSGFNCRHAVAPGPPQWSNHAYGRAIDVNPVENPYLLGGDVLPPAGADFVDRSTYRPGMAVPGGDLTAAFGAAGWSWGGVWSSPDYQHFDI